MLASLSNGVIFKKAFANKIVFNAFIRRYNDIQCAKKSWQEIGGESPLGTLTEGTPHRRDKGARREGGTREGASGGSLRWSVESNESEAP